MGISENLFSQREVQRQRSDQANQMTQEDLKNQKTLTVNLLSFLDSSGLLTYLDKYKVHLGTAAALIASSIAGYLIYASKKVARVPSRQVIGAGVPPQLSLEELAGQIAKVADPQIRQAMQALLERGIRPFPAEAYMMQRGWYSSLDAEMLDKIGQEMRRSPDRTGAALYAVHVILSRRN